MWLNLKIPLLKMPAKAMSTLEQTDQIAGRHKLIQFRLDDGHKVQIWLSKTVNESLEGQLRQQGLTAKGDKSIYLKRLLDKATTFKELQDEADWAGCHNVSTYLRKLIKKEDL